MKKFVEKQLIGIPLIGLSQINRVKALSEEIAKDLEFDELILDTSIMLHNIGIKQWMEFNNNQIITSVNVSKRFLSDNFFPGKKIPEVLHAIEQCHVKGIPMTLEAKILHDSFLLDEIGAIGVLKDCFVFVKEKKPFNQWISSAKSNLGMIRNSFNLDSSKELSISRIEFYENYYNTLEKESL
ncbi:MAG: hypothetical protein Q7S21_03120 [archaeon]|nr:hypothetical protein [archaeon]